MIEEAATIGAKCLVFISGGLEDGAKDLTAARARTLEAVTALLPDARSVGVKLGIEPLHPMMCANRAVFLHPQASQ